METRFPYVKVTAALRKTLGAQVPGTRIYEQRGNQEEYVKWFDALCAQVGPCVAPGGAAARAHVTRAGVYRRMNAGKLSSGFFKTDINNWSDYLYYFSGIYCHLAKFYYLCNYILRLQI